MSAEEAYYDYLSMYEPLIKEGWTLESLDNLSPDEIGDILNAKKRKKKARQNKKEQTGPIETSMESFLAKNGLL